MLLSYFSLGEGTRLVWLITVRSEMQRAWWSLICKRHLPPLNPFKCCCSWTIWVDFLLFFISDEVSYHLSPSGWIQQGLDAGIGRLAWQALVWREIWRDFHAFPQTSSVMNVKEHTAADQGLAAVEGQLSEGGRDWLGTRTRWGMTGGAQAKATT